MALFRSLRLFCCLLLSPFSIQESSKILVSILPHTCEPISYSRFCHLLTFHLVFFFSNLHKIKTLRSVTLLQRFTSRPVPAGNLKPCYCLKKPTTEGHNLVENLLLSCLKTHKSDVSLIAKCRSRLKLFWRTWTSPFKTFLISKSHMLQKKFLGEFKFWMCLLNQQITCKIFCFSFIIQKLSELKSVFFFFFSNLVLKKSFTLSKVLIVLFYLLIFFYIHQYHNKQI